MNNRIDVDGEEYDAVKFQPFSYIVHWYHKDHTMVEAVIYGAHDEMDAIKRAISRGSWA
jgi:hypothetical protein